MTQRIGDVFGSTVNLASRLTALAESGHVLVDQATAEALALRGGYELRALPPQPVRSFGEVVGVVVGAASGDARLGSGV